MSPHTAGPWTPLRIYTADDFEDMKTGQPAEAWWVVGPGWLVGGGGVFMTEADARLIASAPDMLEALENYVVTDPHSPRETACRDRDGGCSYWKARDAIAKARGKAVPA